MSLEQIEQTSQPVVRPKSRISKRLSRIYSISFTDFSLNLMCTAYLEGMRQFYCQPVLHEILQEVLACGRKEGLHFNFSLSEHIDYRWLETCALHGLLAAPGRNRVVLLFPDKHAAHVYQEDLLYHDRANHTDLKTYRKMASILKDRLDRVG